MIRRPDFSLVRKDADAFLVAPPPFELQDVTAQVFPLAASLYKLELFCDSYLNFAPKEAGYFRPAGPFVFLSAIRYGRAGNDMVNLGWVAQNELIFTVPIEWYRYRRRRWEFVGLGAVTPFIYLEDPWAVRVGREVYGWPKVQAWFSPALDPWRIEGTVENRPLVMRTMVFPSLYSGFEPQKRTLLEITQDRRSILSPPRSYEIRKGAWKVLRQLLKVLAGYSLRNVYELTEMLPAKLRAAIFGANPPFRAKGPLQPRLEFQNLTLKQFPRASDPTLYCYQALNTSSMEVQNVNALYPLGAQALSKGRLSGGYQVHIYTYPTDPVVETLGLDCLRWSRRDAEGSRDRIEIATLEPILPMSLRLDMRYGRGVNLCWRATGTPWHVTERPGDPDSRVLRAKREKKMESLPTDDQMLNTSLGAATQTVMGTKQLGTVTYVFPLKADPAKLDALFEEIQESSSVRRNRQWIKSWGSYVYLIVRDYEELAAARDNRGNWLDKSVEFAIPIQVGHRDDLGGRVQIGLFVPFAFNNSELGTTIQHETEGLPAVFSQIETQTMGLGSLLPETRRTLLKLSAHVLPVMNLRQKVEQRPLLEIVEGNVLPHADTEEWNEVAFHWGRQQIQDYLKKSFDAADHRASVSLLLQLAVEILVGQQPINRFALKQFRAIEDPRKASYQALVRLPERIYYLKEIEEIRVPIQIRIHLYPSQPLVDLLGLQVKYSVLADSSFECDVWQGVPLVYLEPVRPFWFRSESWEEPGVELVERSTLDSGWSGPALEGSDLALGGEPIPLTSQDIISKTVLPAHLGNLKDVGAEANTNEVLEALENAEPQWAIEALLGSPQDSKNIDPDPCRFFFRQDSISNHSAEVQKTWLDGHPDPRSRDNKDFSQEDFITFGEHWMTLKKNRRVKKKDDNREPPTDSEDENRKSSSEPDEAD